MSPEAAKRWQQLQLQVGPSSGGSVLRSMALLPSSKAGPILVLIPGGSREPSSEIPLGTNEKIVLGGEAISDPGPIDQAELSLAVQQFQIQILTRGQGKPENQKTSSRET